MFPSLKLCREFRFEAINAPHAAMGVARVLRKRRAVLRRFQSPTFGRELKEGKETEDPNARDRAEI